MRKVFIFLVFFTLPTLLNAGFIMKPYIQAVTVGSAYVLVESDSKSNITINYTDGKQQNRTAFTEYYVETDNSPKSYVHRIKLENLKPETKYTYFALQGNDTSSKSVFTTFPDKIKNFRFGVKGDNRSNPKIHSKTTDLLSEKSPLLLIYTGDICYDSKYKTWKDEFFTDSELRLISEVPFYNAVGNHEGWKQNTKAFTQSPSTEKENRDYYSFDVGDVHFLIISSESSLSKNSSQYKFIEKDLKNTKKKWKVVAFHISAYVAGGHGENKLMKRITSELLKPNGVDIVFSGHSHFYQHNFVNGIHHVTAAGGGAPLYTPKSFKYTIKSVKKHHYLIADVSESKISIKVYDLENKLIEEFDVKK